VPCVGRSISYHFVVELLAPAGDGASLQAALDAGASAVYLGLRALNARRGARNFSQEELPAAVAAAHARSARVYLTLNVDLKERELGNACRMLELARASGADAVLVRDPALLALRPFFPGLELHFSTQTGMASSADVAAARELGAARAVLARELSLREISAASSVRGIGTEVFCQGALCFGVSGRCLLSSWVGGHSGNRGTCASPCRVPWTVAGEPAGTPLSMRDLGTALRLAELRAAGAAALKIEGRLKTPEWVRRAVSLYRRALDGADPEGLRPELEGLGKYTGRDTTCAYLDGERDGLTGLASGRCSGKEVHEAGAGFELHMVVEGSRLKLRCEKDGRSVEWDLPVSAGAKARRRVLLRDALEHLKGRGLSRWTCPTPDIPLAPRMVNALESRVAAALQSMRRREEDPQVRVPLPDAAQAALAKSAPSPKNRLRLGLPPDRVRIEAERLDAFPGQAELIVEGVRSAASLKGRRAVVALPAVFFEADIPETRALLAECAALGLRVEVNSWGGWLLAREAKVRMEAGPGLPVLNSLAAKVLAERGMESVTLSTEADRAALEELTACCPAPCSLTVFGRPPLLVTRARLDAGFLGKTFQDRRGVRMRPALERGLWTFRPETPFDWRDLRNARIRVRHLVVDLVGSPDPAAEWSAVPSREGFRFNYDRELL